MSGGISKANLSPGDNRVVMSEAAAADAAETRPRQTPTLLCVVPQIDPSVPQPVVQSRRRPLLGPSPG